MALGMCSVGANSVRKSRAAGGNPPSEAFGFAGQSNSSSEDSTVLSSTPSGRHWRPKFGVRARATDALTPLVHLYEQASDTGYGVGETEAYAFAAMYDTLDVSAPRWFCANHAKNAAAIAAIKKGGTATCYADGQAQVTASGNLPVFGIGFNHGETDTQNNNTTYPTDYVQLQSDYTTDTQAKTGQVTQVLFYALQNAAYPPGSTSATGLGASNKLGSCQLTYLDKAVNVPTKFKCVGYGGNALPSAWIAADGLHYTAGYKRVLAAQKAKFVYRTRHSQDDLPLYMTGAVRTGASIVATFHVPVGSLVWRLDLVQPRTTGNTGALLGFRFKDDSGSPPAVTAVAITASNQVTVTLASTPTGTAATMELQIGHATTQTSGDGCCPLADSDTTVDPFGWPLVNLCCAGWALTG